MPVIVPELRIGTPLQLGPWIVHPLYEAQMRLFDDDALAEIGVLSRRTSVLATKAGKSRPRVPTVSNNSTTPLLALPGRRIPKGQVLRTPVLVPPSRTLEVPVMCRSDFVGGSNLSGRAITGAVGVVVATAFIQYLHLFGTEGLCGRAWKSLRVTGVGRGEPMTTEEIHDLLSTLRSSKWKRVKSLGMGQEWMTLRRGLRGSAVTLGRNLVYLVMVRNEMYE